MTEKFSDNCLKVHLEHIKIVCSLLFEYWTLSNYYDTAALIYMYFVNQLNQEIKMSTNNVSRTDGICIKEIYR